MDFSSLPNSSFDQQMMSGFSSPVPPTTEMYTQQDMIAPPPTQQQQASQQVNNDLVMQDKIALLKEAIQKQKRGGGKRTNGDIISMVFSKKREFVKLMLLAFTMLFAMSMHTVFYDLLRNFINSKDFTAKQEIMVKLGYPLAIMIVMWLLRVTSRN